MIFKEDIEQYNNILNSYEDMSSEDMQTAYDLAKLTILTADRWNEIALNASKIGREVECAKTDIYNYAYHKYRILMTLHEFCRVIYKKCSDDLRNRRDDFYC